MQRLINTLEAGKVTRYHAAPTVRPQTVAHHSWGVAMLYAEIADSIDKATLLECLLHDTAELFTGDIPFTTKRDNPAIKELSRILEEKHRKQDLILQVAPLSDKQQALLKVCDTLEGLIWCTQNEVNGPVMGRWFQAYHVCQVKFKPLLSSGEMDRADQIFRHFTQPLKPTND